MNRLLFEDIVDENPDFLSEQLITYIGNKRSLLPFIGRGLDKASNRLGKKKLRIFDAFSGSGIVSRFMKGYAKTLIVNDLEKYAEVISKCYLTNKEDINLSNLTECYNHLVNKLELGPLRIGIITELYAPEDDKNIKQGERVFYTNRNAKYIDTARMYIENLPEEVKIFLLAPLLSEASIHANTSGVFKGFYKDSEKKIGMFGGNNGDALLRIKGNISIPFPVFSNYSCEVQVHRGDSNTIAKCIDEVDLTYIDPPYNQHPYGSNYFMLNLIVDYIQPTNISDVSGIPSDWNRSDYNKRKLAIDAFEDLVETLPSKFLIISFNSEGFISIDQMKELLNKKGKTEVLETKYNTFRGSRNLRERPIHISEYLFLVEKK